MEAALLSIAGKRHFEEGPVEAGAGRRIAHDGADALQKADDGNGAVAGDAPLEARGRSKMRGSAFARRQLIDWRQHEIVEIPSVGSETLQEVAAFREDFLDRSLEIATKVTVSVVEEGSADGSRLGHEER